MKVRAKQRFHTLPRTQPQESNGSEDEFDDIVALIFLLAAESKTVRKARQRGKAYLMRADLLRHPRAATPWEAIYRAGNDRAFIATTGFDVASFHALFKVFGQVWDGATIPRGDVEMNGASRPARRSLNATASLGLVLHYLNSTMKETTLQQIFAIMPAVSNRYILFALRILGELLQRIPDGEMSWSRQATQFGDYASMIRMVTLW